MKENLTPKQLILISAYLDDRLSPLERKQVEDLAQRNMLFKQTLEEMRYTRRMLRSLPVKKAPRNFTLPQTYARVPARRTWLQPAMAFSSIAAALVVVVLFITTSVMPGAVSTKSAPGLTEAPAMLTAPDNARAAATSESPMIILWNGITQVTGLGAATGMGGGGGGGDGNTPVTVPGYGIGGGGAEGSGLPSILTTEEPTFTPEQLAQANPQNLILGLPSANDAGKEITPAGEQAPSPEVPARHQPLSPAALLEIFFGSVALAAGVMAILLRRRR